MTNPKHTNNSRTLPRFFVWIIVIACIALSIFLILALIYVRFILPKPFIEIPPENPKGLLISSGIILSLFCVALFIHSCVKIIVKRHPKGNTSKTAKLLQKIVGYVMSLAIILSYPFHIAYINTIDRIPGLYGFMKWLWFEKLLPLHYKGFVFENKNVFARDCWVTWCFTLIPYFLILFTLALDVLIFEKLNWFYYSISVFLITITFKVFLAISRYILYATMRQLHDGFKIEYLWETFGNHLTYKELIHFDPATCGNLYVLVKLEGVDQAVFEHAVWQRNYEAPKFPLSVVLIEIWQRQLSEDPRFVNFMPFIQCSYIFLWTIVFIRCLLAL
jgi:hypothetical protein